MRKALRKMMALVIAMVMVLAMTLPAMAATNNLTKDGTINVSGLEEGDTVEFYRVLKFDSDAAATGGWSADTGFTDLTTAQIQKMLALDTNGNPVTITDENKDQYGIDETLAGTIGDMAEGATAKYTSSTTPAVVISDGTATVTAPDDGLYVAIIHPGQPDTIYNPVFVGADYQQPESGTDPSSNWTVDISDSYSPESMAKRAKITLDKTADTTEAAYEDQEPETVAAGDIVSFTVDTTIPEFANNYTNAVFKVTDTLSAGLEYQNDAKVYVVTKTEDPETGDDIETETQISDTDKLTITPTGTDGKGGYIVSFTTNYLLSLEKATDIRIKYTAKVTTDAPTSVNVEKNDVVVNFSNSPTDSTGKGILKDETKHYTFDIDATLLGNSDYPATEVVKVGVDADGKEITETITLPGNQNAVGALEGAEFKLYVADTDSTTKIKDEAGTEITASVYTNDILKADSVIVSDANGRLTIQGENTPGIRGLDAGTYYLVETKAPNGYIKAQNATKIVIDATIVDTQVTEYFDESDGKYYTEQNTNGTRVEVKYSVPTLTSYKVLINGKETANYTMTNDQPNEGDSNANADAAVGENGLIGATGAGANADAGKIINKQGVELPSTGGIGTTIFYLVGTILVLGAGILLITRRRMSAK